MPATLISIDGSPGAGKSTLLTRLKEAWGSDVNRRKVVFVQEPVDKWREYRTQDGLNTIFDLYYQDQKRYAFAFQIMVIHTRFEMLYEIIQANTDVVIITERDLTSDSEIFARLLSDSGNFNQAEYQVYKSVCSTYIDKLQRLCEGSLKRVYLNTPPQICFKRMKVRGRKEEEEVSLRYLENVDAYHRNFMDTIDSGMVLELDGSVDFNSSPVTIEKWMESLKRFCFENAIGV